MIKKEGKFEATRVGDVLEITLWGEIDHHNAVAIRGELDARLYEEHPRKAVLDLSNIEFMDSSGLGLIMGRYSLMQKLGGELTVRDPHPRLVKIFQMAGLERMVTIETSETSEKSRKEGRT